MFRALIVEDDSELAERLSATLRLWWPGSSLGRVCSAIEAASAVQRERPSLMVLELRLRTLDALDGLALVRRHSSVPVVAISGPDSEGIWSRGLELGADEYLSAPLVPVELLARATAVAEGSTSRPGRPAGDEAAPAFDDGQLTLDLSRHRALVRGTLIRLTRPESQFLACLLAASGSTVPESVLLARLWGDDARAETAFLRVYARRLRQKIEPDPGSPHYLTCERGVGYRFTGELSAGQRRARTRS